MHRYLTEKILMEGLLGEKTRKGTVKMQEDSVYKDQTLHPNHKPGKTESKLSDSWELEEGIPFRRMT